MRSFIFILIFSFLLCACQREPNDTAQGYIEGRYTYIATSVSGVLKEILVQRGARVARGQLLFQLEEQPESDTAKAAEQSLQETIAARDAIVANLTYAKLTYERYKILVPKQAIQQSQLDNARSTYSATLAQLAQANSTIAEFDAKLASAKWTLSQKRTYAPIDGIVFDVYYRIGEYTNAQQPILSLLAPEDIKVIFYVKEKFLAKLKLNDALFVHCDSCAKAYKGHISFISPTAEYTPPVIYSTETNEKLVYRIEARFPSEDAYQLHPGQPVFVTFS